MLKIKRFNGLTTKRASLCAAFAGLCFSAGFGVIRIFHRSDTHVHTRRIIIYRTRRAKSNSNETDLLMYTYNVCIVVVKRERPADVPPTVELVVVYYNIVLLRFPFMLYRRAERVHRLYHYYIWNTRALYYVRRFV